MLNHHHRSRGFWRQLTAIATVPLLGLGVWGAIDAHRLLLAQPPVAVPALPVPASLPQGTSMRVAGSSSMELINQALKQQFEAKFPGTTVNLATTSTNESLQALLSNAVDLAAVGRSLTASEKAQGLQEIPVSREKIAIIVGAANPFKASLTDQQFAKIFRGEITNWAQLGGPNVPIRFIDRPEASDTRQALSQYPAFKAAPFKAGATATQVMDDATAIIVPALGSDGISYAIAGQVLNQPNVTVLPMHDTLPTDPRYPYSQPRSYVYKATANAGVLAFIGFATSAPGQAVVAVAKQQEAPNGQLGGSTPSAAIAAPGSAISSMAPTPSGLGSTPGTEPSMALPPATRQPLDGTPLLWLLLPLLGLPLLWWWLRERDGAIPSGAELSTPGRLILTPLHCRDAYAYWEVPEAAVAAARAHGGCNLQVRLYDVTDNPQLEQAAPDSVETFDCVAEAVDRHLPIAVDNRDYVAELGYLTAANHWLRLARSPAVRVPACDPATKGGVGSTIAIAAGSAAATHIAADVDPEQIEVSPPDLTGQFGVLTGAGSGVAGAALTGVGAAIAGGTAAIADFSPIVPSLGRRRQVAGGAAFEQAPDCRIILVPRDEKAAYAYWEVADAYHQALQAQGGRRLMLRIHDATNLDIDQEAPHTTQTYVCYATDQDKHVMIPISDRDYIAELGYFTDANRWLRIICSFPVHVPAVPARHRNDH